MRRREVLVAALASLALARAGLARAQAKRGPATIGWLNINARESGQNLAAFKEGLAALGWKEGADYRLEERWADGHTARLEPLAKELAAIQPAVIVAAQSGAVAAAAKAAPGTPVVAAGGDPVAAGLVKSLAKPGGMITGLSNAAIERSEKLLELLLLAAPGLRRVGFLVDPAIAASDATVQAANRSVQHHRIDARFARAAKPDEIEPALARLAGEGARGLILLPSSAFGPARERIARLALSHRLPSISPTVGFADAGGLLSYGVDGAPLYRRAAYYVDRILKGAKPGDLPIELPTRIELVVNAKTAKALGLRLSAELLFRADRVIE